MKTSILMAASAMALAVACPAFAQHDDRACIDEACTMVSLVGLNGQGAQPSTGLINGTEAPSFGTWGFDMAGRDTSVSPGDDFNRFANGLFLDALEIPADRTRYGAFDMLAELSENRMRTLIADISAMQNLDPTTDEGRFLRRIRDEACDVFGTVLSPEYNEAHRDHLHLDGSRTPLCS